MKVLNLYAGIGGNRKLWRNVEVTAVEINPKIAEIYSSLYPKDKVVVADAHKYLLEHYNEFDFIWTSPPCPTHSRMRYFLRVGAMGITPKYPDMRLYQEIIFLKHHFKGNWVVENVNSYYEPLIKPYLLGRHFFWSNFHIPSTNHKHKEPEGKLEKKSVQDLQAYHDIDLTPFDITGKRLLLRNCVEPKLGLYILYCLVREKQRKLRDFEKCQ